MDVAGILKTEYCPEFDEIRKKQMATSYFKYGPVAQNYPQNVDAIASAKLRIEKYEQTGNTEFLADAANELMIEFMRPRNPKAHYTPSDSDESPGLIGVSVNEAKEYGAE